MKCPVPTICNIIADYDEIPLKILFKNNNDSSSLFVRIKREVDKFVAANTSIDIKDHHRSIHIPEEVNIPEQKTVASDAKSSECLVMNERLTAFLHILFAKPAYDKDSDVSFLEPAIIADSLQEILTATSNTSQQASMVLDAIKVLSDDIADKKYYLSRSSCFPFISSTLITYMLQTHYHSKSIDVDLESLKKNHSAFLRFFHHLRINWRRITVLLILSGM